MSKKMICLTQPSSLDHCCVVLLLCAAVLLSNEVTRSVDMGLDGVVLCIELEEKHEYT